MWVMIGLLAVIAIFAAAFRLPTIATTEGAYGSTVPQDGDVGRRSARQDTLAVFEHPQNGYREQVPRLAWLWMMLFGIFYLMARQLWGHVVIVALIIVAVVMVSPWLLLWVALPAWLFYIGKAGELISASYYRRGWRLVDTHEGTLAPEIADGSL